jgi:uncharacterized protein YecT (DUF1311 family)
MLMAILLAAATQPCADANTQTDMTICWSEQAKKSDAQLNATYQRVRKGVRDLGADPDVLVSPELAWISARDATCKYEMSLTEGGSISPMEGAMCVDRMTQAQTKWLSDFLETFKAEGVIETAKPVSDESSAAFDDFVSKLKAQLSGSQLSLLANAQSAWRSYRDKACKVAGYECLTDLTDQRVEELKAGWMGEQFW